MCYLPSKYLVIRSFLSCEGSRMLIAIQVSRDQHDGRSIALIARDYLD